MERKEHNHSKKINKIKQVIKFEKQKKNLIMGINCTS
jgi:ABC-type Fe3+-citrate transport system substrate-binding protein